MTCIREEEDRITYRHVPQDRLWMESSPHWLRPCGPVPFAVTRASYSIVNSIAPTYLHVPQSLLQLALTLTTEPLYKIFFPDPSPAPHHLTAITGTNPRLTGNSFFGWKLVVVSNNLLVTLVTHLSTTAKRSTEPGLGENHIIVRLLGLTQYQRVTDRQTGRHAAHS